MNTLAITRGSEAHGLHWEITPEGEFTWYATRELTLGGQPVQVEIDKMEQVFANGVLSAIHTHYTLYALDNEGNKIDPHKTNSRYYQDLSMTANKRDRKEFARMFGPSLVPSMWNGYVRSALGHNLLPVFNGQGGVLSYTPEQEAQAPTWDYFTHHSDGTPLDAPVPTV